METTTQTQTRPAMQGKLATMRRHPDPETAASLIRIVKEGSSLNYCDEDICTFYCAEYGSENEAIANRLVACWNACEGIADPSAIPDLLAALIELASGTQGDCKGDGR